MLDEFSTENSVLTAGATSGPLSEEVVGELVDSETTPLSSPHACTHVKSHIT